jgi:hypothetical protein
MEAITKNRIKTERTTFLFFLVICCVYLLFGFGVNISNDSCTNLEQIRALNILSRSSHFSFHLFGVLAYMLFSGLFKLSSITSVEWMLSFMSVAGSISLYCFIFNWRNDRFMAILSTIIYAFSTGVFRFSIQSEYLILVPSFALIALALSSRGHFIFAGIPFAFAMLTSPFSLLMSPAFFILPVEKNKRFKNTILFFTGFATVLLMVNSFTFYETIEGEWSYALVYNFYEKVLAELNYLRVCSVWLYGYLRSFLFLLPILLYGCCIVWKRERKFFFLFLLMVLIHLPVAIPENRYGGYQLTLYPFVAIVTSFGLMKIYRNKRIIATSILLLFLLTNFFIVYSERKFNRDLRDAYVMMQTDPAIPDASIIFVYQATKPIKTIYAPRLEPVSLFTSYQEGLTNHLENYKIPKYKELIENSNNLYLLESGTSMPDDHIKKLFSGFVKGQGAKLKGFGKEKIRNLLDEARFVPLERYPLPLYRIVKPESDQIAK